MSGWAAWVRYAARNLGAACGREERPSKLVFVVTKRCHSRCVYCDIWRAKDAPGGLADELTLTEVRAVAAANPYLQWIDFTGGEPTDRPDFVAIVQAFAEACPGLLLIHFPTNGIATRRILDIAMQLQASVRARLVVTVSIDGPPELNDQLRGIRSDFAHAIATFAAVRKRLGAKNCFVGMTLHAHSGMTGAPVDALVDRTFAAVNQALAAADEPPIDWSAFHINIPHLSSHYYGNHAASERDGYGNQGHRTEMARALRVAARRAELKASWAANLIERVYRIEAQHYLAKGRPRIGCVALQTTVYLAANGEVFPCTIWNRPLGNLRTTQYALMPLVAAARRAGVRRAIVERKCPNCWTPCEAYPAILASPGRALRTLLKGFDPEP